MNIRLTRTAEIEHAQTGQKFKISADTLTYRELETRDRDGNPEKHYEAVTTHSRLGRLRWNIWDNETTGEYGIETDLSDHELIKDFTVAVLNSSQRGQAPSQIAETTRQHLDWLLEGSEAWNARRAKQDFRPDLPHTDIFSAFQEAGRLDSTSRIPLPNVDFVIANLEGANLCAADLNAAIFRGANLRGANLRRANFSKANCIGADFRGAVLRRTDFQGAILEGANVQSNLVNPETLEPRTTDLSSALSLTQEQIDSMEGDSGTIIPSKLTRPAHWPELDGQEPEEASFPSPQELIVERLQQASPIDLEAQNGKLVPVDTPPNVSPELVNPADRDARLSGLRQSLSQLQGKASDHMSYQLPPALFHCLNGIDRALSASPLTWYALEDSRNSLADCMVEYDATDIWNGVIVGDLNRLIGRIGELRSLLQPRQVPSGQPGAKPPEPELDIRADQLPDLADIARNVNVAKNMPQAQDVLGLATLELLGTHAEQILDAEKVHNDEHNQSLARRGVLGLAYLIGAIIKAVSDIGKRVAASFLTNPDAAATLAQRLQPIYDAILKLFL